MSHDHLSEMIKGGVGTFLAIISPFLKQFNELIATVGGLAGLVLLYFSIKNMFLRNKKIKDEINENNQDKV